MPARRTISAAAARQRVLAESRARLQGGGLAGALRALGPTPAVPCRDLARGALAIDLSHLVYIGGVLLDHDELRRRIGTAIGTAVANAMSRAVVGRR
jgi:hypothetical protein